ncbi:hypothetical protein BDV96DRAFT_577253 [Lophiotrema nucula]|uniref:Uncharacterized protein n=1 Tax=Lophiotrema nucula TaxID=690887 RepID=A0A6A5Z6B7_9PLEO|nr:hypothetical protein BDV96DRAFT_577253 [Lophiotrema nucula]
MLTTADDDGCPCEKNTVLIKAHNRVPALCTYDPYISGSNASFVPTHLNFYFICLQLLFELDLFEMIQKQEVGKTHHARPLPPFFFIDVFPCCPILFCRLTVDQTDSCLDAGCTLDPRRLCDICMRSILCSTFTALADIYIEYQHSTLHWVRGRRSELVVPFSRFYTVSSLTVKE